LRSSRLVVILRTVLWLVGGLVVAAALLVGVTSVTLPGCTTCHAGSSFESDTKAEAHAKIDCVRCHVKDNVGARISYAANEIFGMALHVSQGDGRARAQVDDPTCLSCHQEIDAGVAQGKGIRIKHATCAKGRACTDCHSDTAHGTVVKWPRASKMNICLDCHATNTVRASCATCHVSKTSAQLMASKGFDAVHDASWKLTHGMGELKTCAACHEPDYCAKCHGIALPHPADFLESHGALAVAKKSACAKCHRPAFCSDCHGIEMPHPTSFAPTHSSVVKAKGEAVCRKCHVADDCTTCHIQHIHPGGATSSPRVSP
jgi:hypothetical protein